MMLCVCGRCCSASTEREVWPTRPRRLIDLPSRRARRRSRKRAAGAATALGALLGRRMLAQGADEMIRP